MSLAGEQHGKLDVDLIITLRLEGSEFETITSQSLAPMGPSKIGWNLGEGDPGGESPAPAPVDEDESPLKRGTQEEAFKKYVQN